MKIVKTKVKSKHSSPLLEDSQLSLIEKKPEIKLSFAVRDIAEMRGRYCRKHDLEGTVGWYGNVE